MPLLCLVVLGFGQLCFVRERRRPVPINKDTRMLTSKIKKAETVPELLDVVDGIVDKPLFDYIHAAAAYTKLGNLQKQHPLGQKEAKSAVLLRLQNRLQGMLVRKEVGPQALSNILWAVANLYTELPTVQGHLPALVLQIPLKVGDMDPQGLSNSLWAAAQLQDAAPEVLKMVPTLAAQIRLSVGKMIPQHVSNSLWAAARLQGAAPSVLDMVPALVEEIPLKAGGMIPQQLSNSLWALKSLAEATPTMQKAVSFLVKEFLHKINSTAPQNLANALEALVFLADCFPIVQLPSAVEASAARLNRILPRLKGKDLQFAVPVVVWACGRSNVYDAKLFTAAADRFSSRHAVASLPDWNLCALKLGGFADRLQTFALV